MLGAMSIAFSGIFYRWSEVSPSTGTFYRCLFGLPFLAAVAYVERRKFGPLPRATVRLALIAGIFFAGDLTFWHHAIEFVGAGLATVLGNLQVLIVALVAWAVFGERPPRSVILALPIVLFGVVLISGIIGTGAYGSAPVIGVLLGIATALCYSGYLLIIRRGGRDLRRPAGPVAISTLSTTLCAAAAGVVIGDIDFTPGAESLFWLAALGITSQFLGYLLISLSLPRLPAVVTSIILLTQPVATVALAYVLLGETPSAAQLAGVGLVIGGIAIATVPAGLAAGRAQLRPRREASG
ncbi:MAG TPA: DMT family transporter [Candidatus Limnocylindrales bacterium]|nr:DMT family transporter [Candidatus Limnocylindrales bacterium]